MTHHEVGERLLPPGAFIVPLDLTAPESVKAAMAAKSRHFRGPSEIQFLWNDCLLPLGEVMVPGITAAVDLFEPDVIVVDQLVLAGSVVAQQRGLPWATMISAPPPLADPLAEMPLLAERLSGSLEAFGRRFGLKPDRGRPSDLLYSRDLVLALTVEDLLNRAGPRPEHFTFVGPLGVEPDESSAEVEVRPWDRLGPGERLVTVTPGSVPADLESPFLEAVVEALGELSGSGVQGVLLVPPDRFRDLPPNVVAYGWTGGSGPSLSDDLLARTDLLISHAGHFTCCRALSFGVPLVMAPIRYGQPWIAEMVAHAGAGVRVRYHRARSAEIRHAVGTVLGEPRFGEAARGLQTSLRAAGGVPVAADHLELLLRDRAATSEPAFR